MIDEKNIQNSTDLEVKSKEVYLDELHKKVIGLEITSLKEFNISTDLLKSIKKSIKSIEDKRKEFTGPLNDFVKKINSSFKLIKNKADNIQTELCKKISNYNYEIQKQKQKEEEERRKKELKKLENEKAIKKINMLFSESKESDEIEKESIDSKIDELKSKPVEINTTVRTGKTTTSFIKKWVFEMIDPYLIPRELCVPDRKKIQDAIDAGLREIPGIKIFQKEEIRSR